MVVTKPEVSKDEEAHRNKLFPDIEGIKNKNVLCASCNNSVKESMLKGKNIWVHPFLETLLCEKCHQFFGDGDFSVDEDGSDKYCRWCGQGGTLYLCSSCTAGFCKKCIKRNLPKSALNEVEDDDWQCYCCNVKPLYDLRAYCWAAQKYAEAHKPAESNSRKRKAEESKAVKKKKARTSSRNDKNLLKSKQIGVAVNKLAVFFQDGVELMKVVKKKEAEYKRRGVFSKKYSSIEEVEELSKKVSKVLDDISSTANTIKANIETYTDAWLKVVQEEIEEKNEEKDEEDDDGKDEEDDNGKDEEEKHEDERMEEEEEQKDEEMKEDDEDKKDREEDDDEKSSNRDSEPEEKASNQDKEESPNVENGDGKESEDE